MKSVQLEIVQLVEEMAKTQGNATPSKLAQILVNKYGAGVSDEGRWLMYEGAREKIGACVRRLGVVTVGDDVDDVQPMFPGMPRIQPLYSIKRNGEQVLAAVWDMSQAERHAKADELEDMANTLKEHATQLRGLTAADLAEARRIHKGKIRART